MDCTPDRAMLQTLQKKKDESFKNYAMKWRDMASQVRPPLTEREFAKLFIDSLENPFYEMLICCSSMKFSDLVLLGSRVEEGVNNGKIPNLNDKSEKGNLQNDNAPPVQYVRMIKAQHVTTARSPTTYDRSYGGQPRRKFTRLPISASALYDQLLNEGKIAPIPTEPYTSSFPAWYDESKTCKYHSDVQGHDIKNCFRFKHRVQDMIEEGSLSLRGRT